MASPFARINYALAATLLTQGLSLGDAANQVGAKNANSLRRGLARRGVTATQCKRAEVSVTRARIVAERAVSQASEALRGTMAADLAETVANLGKVRQKANLKALKARAEVLEPLARTAKIVHDWGNTQSIGLVALGTSGQVETQVERPAIELTPQPVEPELAK